MSNTAADRRLIAGRIVGAYGARLHRLTLRRRIRNALEAVSAVYMIEIAAVAGVGALLFIH